MCSLKSSSSSCRLDSVTGVMRRLPLVLVTSLLLRSHVLCEFPSTMRRHHEKRSLVYPSPTAKVQTILGAGFPVDLQDESVLIGIVVKAQYVLPRNASDYTSPNIYYMRRKRGLRDAVAGTMVRWDMYKILEMYAKTYGFGGKECLLRTICELSEVPIDKSRGILHEIVHMLFQPTSTPNPIQERNDDDYIAAEMLGRKESGRCAMFYRDCLKSYVDLFTVQRRNQNDFHMQ